jgi:hypothetical protein
MTNFYALLCAIALISLSSCRTFYQSAPTPTPILKEKGDGNIFLSLNDAQVSYSPLPNIGFIASAHFDNKGYSLFSDTTGVISKLLDGKLEDLESKGYQSLQGGAMFFQRLDHSKTIQAGIIAGTYQPSMLINVNRGIFKKDTDERLSYKCFKTDLFMNYAHSTKYLDFITSIKLVGTKYNEALFDEPLVEKELSKMEFNKHPTIGSMYYFIEPSATLQYGFANFKFHVQGFYSQVLKENTFAKDQFGVSWGLNYQFNVGGDKSVKKKRMRV